MFCSGNDIEEPQTGWAAFDLEGTSVRTHISFTTCHVWIVWNRDPSQKWQQNRLSDLQWTSFGATHLHIWTTVLMDHIVAFWPLWIGCFHRTNINGSIFLKGICRVHQIIWWLVVWGSFMSMHQYLKAIPVGCCILGHGSIDVNGASLALVVPWRNFNLNRNFPLHKRCFTFEKGSLDYLNVLNTKLHYTFGPWLTCKWPARTSYHFPKHSY